MSDMSSSSIFREDYLKDFFGAFIQMEFMHENYPCDIPGECGTFYDNGFGSEDLCSSTAERLIFQCTEFVVENHSHLELVHSYGFDAGFCGQGFSLARRGDRFAFTCSNDAPKEFFLLFEAASKYPVYWYEISVEGIHAFEH